MSDSPNPQNVAALQAVLSVERELQALEQQQHRLHNVLRREIIHLHNLEPYRDQVKPARADIRKLFASIDRKGSAAQEVVPVGSLRLAELLVNELAAQVPDLPLPKVERGARFPIIAVSWRRLTWAIDYPRRDWPAIHVRAYGYTAEEVCDAVVESFYFAPSLMNFSKEYV